MSPVGSSVASVRSKWGKQFPDFTPSPDASSHMPLEGEACREFLRRRGSGGHVTGLEDMRENRRSEH